MSFWRTFGRIVVIAIVFTVVGVSGIIFASKFTITLILGPLLIILNLIIYKFELHYPNLRIKVINQGKPFYYLLTNTLIG